MSDRIKKIKVKKADGSMSDYIPIGTNDEYVDLSNGTNLKDFLEKRPFIYLTVDNMKKDSKLKEGFYAKTLGYYNKYDAGAAMYRIVSGSYTEDGGSYIKLNNNLYAELIVENNEISYNQFGAYGDGIHDDWQALSKTHAFANEYNCMVVADTKSTYYVKESRSWIPVRTSTDWRNAHFIIDDREVESRKGDWLFAFLGSPNETFPVEKLPKKIKAKQGYIEEFVEFGSILLTINDNNHKLYREGLNSSDVSSVQETIRVQNGYVLDNINFDYPNGPTSASYRQMGTEMDVAISAKNGIFTTYANTVDSYNYWARSLFIRRDNFRLENIAFYIEKENETTVSSPYQGFIKTDHCSNVTIENCQIQAHKMYQDIGGAWKGSYSLSSEHCCDIFCKNIRQIDSIEDTTKWGVHTSNNCHNLHFENCMLNRIDCHRYLDTWEIKNCKIGHQGLKTGYGFGTALIENTEVSPNGAAFYELRTDYGSSFDGKMIIKNCVLNIKNTNDSKSFYYIFSEGNNADFDYGYKCYFPQLDIDGFTFKISKEETKVSQDIYCAITQATGQGSNIYNLTYEECASIQRYPYISKNGWNLKNLKVEEGKEDYLSYVLIPQEASLMILYMEETGKSINGNDLWYAKSGDPIYNMNINIDNCHFGNKNKINRPYENSLSSFILNFWVSYVKEDMTNTHRPVTLLNINNCKDLQLGTKGDAIFYRVTNSDIYLVRGGSEGYNRTGFLLDNCRIHYKKWAPDKQVLYFNRATILNSVFLFSELPEEYSYDDFVNSEDGPFGTIWVNGVTDNKHAVLHGCLRGNTYDVDPSFFETTRFKDFAAAFEITSKNIADHEMDAVYFRKHGSESRKPVGSAQMPVPEHFIYHATDTNKWYYWNSAEKTWVMFIDNSQ